MDGAFQKYPYLHLIVVKSSLRGKGIGKALIQYFEQKVCTGHNKTFLMVGDFNSRAKALYEKLGYKEIGTIPGFYKNGVNEYLMMKEMNTKLN